VAAELAANREFYARNVRLVYGGGARNNAELFLPRIHGGRATWTARPTFDEIMSYQPKPEGLELMTVLKNTPGVGLIFVRKQNGEIPDNYEPRQGRMEIVVLDRMGNQGAISVERDTATGELIYGYRTDESSQRDPLGYNDLPRDRWTYGTYSEWNDRSVREQHYHHNAVAGMGSFLYSNNPSIGDVTLMHSQGWNFGENAGGHGGIHREEKVTVMMLSGPGISKGELLSQAKFKALPDGSGVAEAPWLAYPTVVDLAPTVLNWLGYGPEALSTFAKDGGFERQFRGWAQAQQGDILRNLDRVDGVEQAARDAGVDLRPSRFRPRLQRLLRFMPTNIPRLPDYRGFREDGNQLRY
jgi:hypothetical protein